MGGPFPSLGDLPNPGIKPRSPTLQADSLPAEPPGKSKNTAVGSLSLLQQIFLTQELNWGLLHCRWILYQLSYQGSPYYRYTYEWVSESSSVVSKSLGPHVLYRPWNSSGQNAGVGSHSLPRDLPSPGIEPGSPGLHMDSLPPEPPGKPKHTGVGSLSLLQQIFLTQESNWGLLHCKWILYCELSGKPSIYIICTFVSFLLNAGDKYLTNLERSLNSLCLLRNL